MDGYTYELSHAQLCSNLGETLRSLTPIASSLIIIAANRSNGNPHEFQRIMREFIAVARQNNVVETLVRENDALSAIIEEDCTCNPLDGGLGSITCPYCKRSFGADEQEIPY